jgi:replication initiation protein RepC
MHAGNVATPFGRRPMTLALVRRQASLTKITPGKTADKWRVFRDVSESRILLGLHDRSLAVLDALLSFHPGNELRQDGQLVVFPSNAQLSLRAHGIAGATLRRHLALLVDAGLIVRRDSANGKRFAHKDGHGAIEHAYGFDLTPILARADELANMAQQVMADRVALRRAKERLTICRRNVRKLITAALEEGAGGDWTQIEKVYLTLVGRMPRAPSLSDINDVLDEMTMLLEEIVNRLEFNANVENSSISDAHDGRHIQSSESESYLEFERCAGKEQSGKSRPVGVAKIEQMKSFPLGMVLRACPQVADYVPGGDIRSWRDLMSAAIVVRSVLGVSSSAYQDACNVMGPENAATAIACILERSGHIISAGGYLRDLTRKAEQEAFSLGPMIMALLRMQSLPSLSLEQCVD